MNTSLQQSITEIGYSLYSVAYKFCKDSDVAEDIVQDTILKALVNAEKYREGTNLKGWIYTIMRNIFINEYRRKKKYQYMDSAKEFDMYSPDRFLAINDGNSNMGMEEINKHIRVMENKHTMPFLMHFDGFKYEEIAETLKLPIGTVKNRIHLARKELQTRINFTNQTFSLN
jgi:RNA polymerase sigma factor (sigma-70 family)